MRAKEIIEKFSPQYVSRKIEELLHQVADCRKSVAVSLGLLTKRLNQDKLNACAVKKLDLHSSTKHAALGASILVYSKTPGPSLCEIEVIATGASQALGVTVTNDLVSVQLETDGGSVVQTTFQEFVDAINNDVDAKAKLVAEIIPGVTASTVIDQGHTKSYLDGGEQRAVHTISYSDIK